jgi:hypothetical protein
MSATSNEDTSTRKEAPRRLNKSLTSAFAAPKPATAAILKALDGGVVDTAVILSSSKGGAVTVNPFDEDSTGHESLFGGVNGSAGGASGGLVQRTKSLDVASITERRRCAVEARLRTERAHKEHVEALQYAKEQEDLLHAAEEAFRSKQTKVWSSRYDELKEDYGRIKEERDLLKDQLERSQIKQAELLKETQQQEQWIKSLQANLYEVSKSLVSDKKSAIGRIFGGKDKDSSPSSPSNINRGGTSSQSPLNSSSPNAISAALADSGRMSRNNSFISNALGRMTPAAFGGSPSGPAFDYTPSPKTNIPSKE